jgi:hypothetical protein
MITEQDNAVRHRNRDIGPHHVRRRCGGKTNRAVNHPASDAVQRIHQPASAIKVTTA